MADFSLNACVDSAVSHSSDLQDRSDLVDFCYRAAKTNLNDENSRKQFRNAELWRNNTAPSPLFHQRATIQNDGSISFSNNHQIYGDSGDPRGASGQIVPPQTISIKNVTGDGHAVTSVQFEDGSRIQPSHQWSGKFEYVDRFNHVFTLGGQGAMEKDSRRKYFVDVRENGVTVGEEPYGQSTTITSRGFNFGSTEPSRY